LIRDDDWLVVTDYDIMILLPDTIAHVHEYIARYPEAGILFPFANRSHVNAVDQMLGGKCSEDSDIRNHIKLAQEQKKELYNVTRINRNISGFMMAISKKTWQKIPFTEDLKCLGVDTLFSNRILEAGLPIYRMDGCYVWHTYRLATHVKDTTHLV